MNTVQKGLHLAIFRQPFLNLILAGAKTVESRFSQKKILPFGQVEQGDRVFMKAAGGNIVGEFTVQKVLYFSPITPEALQVIKHYSTEMCTYADPHFWQRRQDAHYATLLLIKQAIRYPKPYPFPKKDRRAWLKLSALPRFCS
jgi:ASCH domain.